MFVTAFFITSAGPQLGLSPTIRIRDVATNTLVVTDAAMSEIGDGLYKYDFIVYDPDSDYVARCDGGATLSGAERYAYAGTESESGDMIAQAVQPYILADVTPFNGADIASIKTTVNLSKTAIDIIRKVETGRWKITGTQMIFYDDGAVIPLLTFNLINDGTNITERVPV